MDKSQAVAAVKRTVNETRGTFEHKLKALFRRAGSQKFDVERGVGRRFRRSSKKGLFSHVGRERVCAVDVRGGVLRSVCSVIPVKVHLGALLYAYHRAYLKTGFKARNYSPDSNPIDLKIVNRETRWAREWSEKEKKDARYMKKTYGRHSTVPIYHLKLTKDVDVYAVDRHRSLKGIVFLRARIPSKISHRLKTAGIPVAILAREIKNFYRRTFD